jgi:TonB family protein
VQLLKGGENLLHRAPVEYPKRAVEKGVAGDVTLSLSLDERGQVQDARVVSGPDELRAAALRSVLRWHYGPSAPSAIDVVLQFRLPEKGERVAEEAEHEEPQEADLRKMHEKLAAEQHARERMQEKLARAQSERQERERRQIDEHARGLAEEQRLLEKVREMEYAKAARESAEHDALRKSELDEQKRRIESELRDKMTYAEAAPHAAEQVARWKTELDARGKLLMKVRAGALSLPGRLSAIHGARLGPEALQALLPQLGVKVGDTLDAAAFERAQAAVAAFDEHIKLELGRAPEDGGLILLLVGPRP